MKEIYCRFLRFSESHEFFKCVWKKKSTWIAILSPHSFEVIRNNFSIIEALDVVFVADVVCKAIPNVILFFHL